MVFPAAMRDVERLREKIEFSLDDRQVWALGLSAVLLLAGVFTLGLLVGRRTAPPPQQASGDLAALDSDGAKEKPGPPLVVPSKPSPPLAAEPPAPEIGSQASNAGAQPARAEAAPEKHDATQGRAPEKHAEPAHAPTVVPPPRPATSVSAPPAPAKVASAATIVLTPPPADPGEFTVQIGSSQERAEAQRMENKARAAGLKPYVVEADLGARGTWYRVRVGAFRDKEAASRYRKDVERELRAAAVVMPSH